MHWADDFVGLPYKDKGRGPRAYDCLGLWIAIQRQVFGREIADPNCSMSRMMRPENRAVLTAQVVETTAPKEGDALLFNVGRRALHIGVCITGNLMLHSYYAASTVERWTGPNWHSKLVKAYTVA